MAFAALGAAEYLRRFPFNDLALDILSATRNLVTQSASDNSPWTDSELINVDALLAHALILSGSHLGDRKALQQGLSVLTWLIDRQTRNGYLSLVGSDDVTPSEELPFVQQKPIEVAHLVDACLDAFDITHDPGWLEPARLGGMWFYGLNDSGAWMHHPQTGGGFEDLNVNGRNPNQTAEATLAYLSSLGQLQRHREDIEMARQAS
jgi:hypothetical protein